MKLSQILSLFQEDLKRLYSKSEIENIFFILAEKTLNQDLFTIRATLNEEQPEEALHFFFFLFKLSELKAGKPIQYVVGETEFFKMKFFVNENVLIPRPETEELVEWIISDHKTSHEVLNILDIGTGSGCIAISLRKYLNAEVYGLDLEDRALDLAKINARYCKQEVTFLQSDILRDDLDDVPNWDIIVSNPPYIRELEKGAMHTNVIDYEPENALFVLDDNPLLFYERICSIAKQKLREGGMVYVEINQSLAMETEALFNKKFRKVDLRKDISGNWRMLKAAL